MAVNKPTKPSSELPNTWGGNQYPYTQQEISSGFLETVPQIIDGGKLNFEKKGIFERLAYTTAIADIINNTPIGQIPFVDSNNKFDYKVLPVIATNEEYKNGSSNVLVPSVKQIKDNVVDLTSNQTIPSNKTFSGNTTVSGLTVNGNIVRKISLDVSQIPTTNTYLLPYTVDNDDQSVRAFQQVSYRTDGNLQNSIGLRRTVNGINIFNGLDLNIDSNGNSSSTLKNLTVDSATATSSFVRPTGVDSKVNPSTYREVVLLEARDANGVLNSTIRTGYRTDGTIDTIIYTGKDGNNKPFIFRMTHDGIPVMLGQTPNVSASGVEVPTAAWVRNQLSSSGNGLATLISNANGNAIKFTNGLIIQWGESQANQSKVTITLPTPFTSGDSYQVFTQFTDGNQSANCTYIENQTATSFQWDRYGGIASFKISWFAIGY